MKLRAAIVALFTIVALVTSVVAQPATKVLVLPLDGNTPAAQRDAINASVVKLAKSKIGGDVTVGETTFNETAAAVGCDPATASCAEQVRTTLAVDELVYGSANTADGNTTITVMRASAGQEPRTQISVIKETDPPETAEGNLDPLFTSAQGGGSDGSGSGSDAPPGPSRAGIFGTTEGKLAVGLWAGGGLALIAGLSMWSSASGKQEDIDNAPRDTIGEINNLRELEDDAASSANWGNVLVVLGLAAGGAGTYFYFKHRKSREAAATTITPAPPPSGEGMTFVLRGAW